MLQSYYSLYRGNGLLVLHLFKNATGLLLVCEHALGIGLKLLLRNIVHSVHCELICSKAFCAREQICLLYLHAELVHKEAAYKLPAIVLDKETELLLDFLHGELTFVGGVNPPLHECLREFEVSLFHEIVTNILRETEVSLVGVLGGEPLVFGENNEYGIMQEGFGLKVVKIGENGITKEDILVHDAHCEDNTLQLKLAMMDNEHGFPIALGVIRDVEAPTYDSAVNEQIEEVKAKKPYHNFMELLETNDIWEVK